MTAHQVSRTTSQPRAARSRSRARSASNAAFEPCAAQPVDLHGDASVGEGEVEPVAPDLVLEGGLRQAAVGEHGQHLQLEARVVPVIDGPLVEEAAQDRDTPSARAGVAVRHRRQCGQGQTPGDEEVVDHCGDLAGRGDGPEVDRQPERPGDGDPAEPDGSEVSEHPGPVEADAGEPPGACSITDRDVDQLGRQVGPPPACSRDVRAHRATSDGQHGSQGALLVGTGRADDAGHAGEHRLELAAVEPPAPRRRAQPRLQRLGPGDEPVLPPRQRTHPPVRLPHARHHPSEL